ncbi:GNAT family N-acetyltransferase [Microbacterium testaceum]|uniref:GNAT family N-acetyltransferase n=1 Tax=Microbacterium testaceum TaxID=2033 RepID=UPI0012AC69F9|nr:GNAT family N-acetyltransferase [Microbacterium testaceum]
MTVLSVRSARPADGRRIAQVHVRSWTEAHAGTMPRSLSDALDEDLSAWRWEVRLAGGTPAGAERLGDAWVADVDGRVVGFASAGPARDADLPADQRELYALYVLAQHHGTGVGPALLEAALGGEPASLWVLDGNDRAVAFYLKHGFRPDGARRDDDRWGDPLHQVRLSRS